MREARALLAGDDESEPTPQPSVPQPATLDRGIMMEATIALRDESPRSSTPLLSVHQMQRASTSRSKLQAQQSTNKQSVRSIIHHRSTTYEPRSKDESRAPPWERPDVADFEAQRHDMSDPCYNHPLLGLWTPPLVLSPQSRRWRQNIAVS